MSQKGANLQKGFQEPFREKGACLARMGQFRGKLTSGLLRYRAPMTLELDAAHDFRGIIPEDRVRQATAEDRIDGVHPRAVVEPADGKELAAVLGFANIHGLAVIPRGGGTKLDWGNPPKSAEVVVSTRRRNRVIEHAAGDMTATVQAGCTIGTFQKTLAENGQRLAIDPVWPDRAHDRRRHRDQ